MWVFGRNPEGLILTNKQKKLQARILRMWYPSFDQPLKKTLKHKRVQIYSMRMVKCWDHMHGRMWWLSMPYLSKSLRSSLWDQLLLCRWKIRQLAQPTRQKYEIKWLEDKLETVRYKVQFCNSASIGANRRFFNTNLKDEVVSFFL